MTDTKHSKILIIGSGPAGYTAAIYTARANLKPMLITGMQPGGQMTTTTEVENYPGFADVIQGPWLMEQMRKQALHVGTDMIIDTITKVDLNSKPKKAFGSSGTIYTADAVIIATGAQAQWLGLETEEIFKGYGVSACATCDGFFYKDKNVAVIGGGNTAVEEALFLTGFAKHVTLIHRRDELRAEKILQDRVFENKKISIMWDSELTEVLGNPPNNGDNNAPVGVSAMKVKNVKTGKAAEYPIDGIFVAIGHKPATDLFKDIIDMDKTGYINTAPDSTATNIEGVFAAGDVADNKYRQAVTAAGMGCMAALEADRWLAEQNTAKKDSNAA